VGPPSVATRINASIAACHSGALVNGLRKLRDVGAGILERDERAAPRQRYRIVKWSLPTLGRFHRPGEPGGIRCLFFGFGGSSNRSIAFSADSIPACRSGALPDFVCPSKTTDHFHEPSRPWTTLYCFPRYSIPNALTEPVGPPGRSGLISNFELEPGGRLII